MAVESFKVNVLHVLTLNARNGEYGGPVRVARELCTEMNNRGHETRIFSGALEGAEPEAKPGLIERFVLVKPLSRKFPISSLWSWRIIPGLIKEIKVVDIVHIHFARDLIAFFAALISVLLGKPFVTQTHGMIIVDGRLSTQLIDFLFTRRLINKSAVNLVLSEIEFASIRNLRVKARCKILPNGIAINKAIQLTAKNRNRVAFCSRLEKRKGVEKFIDLAESFHKSEISFEIYGPDGGELQFVHSEIKSRKLSGSLKYKGSLTSEQVQKVLSEISLLVLPSKNEPFPMVVLEALAVGTPVLVMPSCGFANNLRKFEPSFVAETEDLSGLISALNKQNQAGYKTKSKKDILNYCQEAFGIFSVTNILMTEYRIALKHEE